MFNEDYLDVYLDGTANGWLAIGFSEDRTMVNVHVHVCPLHVSVHPGYTQVYMWIIYCVIG